VALLLPRNRFGAAMSIRHFRGQILLALTALVLLGLGTGFASSQQPPAPKPSPGSDPEAHLGRGYDALKQDQYDAAVSEFRAALKLDPTLTLRARFPLERVANLKLCALKSEIIQTSSITSEGWIWTTTASKKQSGA